MQVAVDAPHAIVRALERGSPGAKRKDFVMPRRPGDPSDKMGDMRPGLLPRAWRSIGELRKRVRPGLALALFSPPGTAGGRDSGDKMLSGDAEGWAEGQGLYPWTSVVVRIT